MKGEAENGILEIQTKNPNEAGYINKDVLDKHKDGNFYCKRCFVLLSFRVEKIPTLQMIKYAK